VNRPGCLICGADLPPQDNGRPRVYCSKGCRRAAEYELKRLQGQLNALEESARFSRLHGTPKRRQAQIQAEIDAATGRLRALLDGLPESVSPPT
jgi:hypothetical protein